MTSSLNSCNNSTNFRPSLLLYVCTHVTFALAVLEETSLSRPDPFADFYVCPAGFMRALNIKSSCETSVRPVPCITGVRRPIPAARPGQSIPVTPYGIGVGIESLYLECTARSRWQLRQALPSPYHQPVGEGVRGLMYSRLTFHNALPDLSQYCSIIRIYIYIYIKVYACVNAIHVNKYRCCSYM